MVHQFETSHLTVGYEENIVIRDLSLEVPSQKVTVLLGANGCGKSTLLKSMARLLKPVESSFVLDGKRIHEWKSSELAKTLGLLPQSPIVPTGIKVSDLISRGRYPYQSLFSSLTSKDYEVIQWAMEEMNISDLAYRNVDELSGGQRQRVWIAMALCQQTDILLLDEPTTYLDIAHQVEILNSVKRLNENHQTTVVVILHDINLSIRYADHIIALKDGKILKQGSPKDIITTDLIKEVYDLDSIILTDPETNLPLVVPKDTYHR